MFSRLPCCVAFLVAFISICDSKLDPLPDCPQRICTCDPKDSSVDDGNDKYMVVIDAGSRHTSAYLYGISPPDLPGLIDYVFGWNATTDFVNNATGLKGLLKPMIHKVSLKVPPCKLCQSPIFLGATAGVRLLRKINESASNELIQEVEKILNNSGFCYKSGNAEILKGSKEAGLTWVAANSICGSGHEKTKGALNLGGGSSEIAFECPDECGNFSSTDNAEVLTYPMFGKDHNVFSQCNDCYGLVQAMQRFVVMIIWEHYILNGKRIKEPIENPCLNSGNKEHRFPTKKFEIFKGYCTWPKMLADPDFKHCINNTLNDDYEFNFVANWNKNECSRVIGNLINNRCKQIFNAKTCFDKPIPGQWDNSEGFIAMGAYYSRFSNIFNSTNGVQNTTTMEDVKKEIERICMESTDGSDADCFGVNYIFEMLTKGYGFNAESFTKLEFTRNMDWPYGYVVINNNYTDCRESAKNRLRGVL